MALIIISEVPGCLLVSVATPVRADWMKQYEEDDVLLSESNNFDGTISEVEMLSSKEYYYIEVERCTGFGASYW